MTWLRCSSLLNKFNLTSLESSLKSARKIGKICSLVCALSTNGQRLKMFSAKAYLTYVNWSVFNLFRFGIT